MGIQELYKYAFIQRIQGYIIKMIFFRLAIISALIMSAFILSGCSDDALPLKPKNKDTVPVVEPIVSDKKVSKNTPKIKEAKDNAVLPEQGITVDTSITTDASANINNEKIDNEKLKQKAVLIDSVLAVSASDTKPDNVIGRELSADASKDEPVIVVETTSTPPAVIIPQNKPTISRLDSWREMGKEVSDNVSSLLKKKPVNFTQCFQSFAEGDYARKIEFYADPERKCWGQSWAIPKSYIYNIREEPNEDVLILRFDVHNFKSEEEIKSLTSTTSLVVVAPSAGFSSKRSIMKRKISSVASVFENRREIFGLDLYEPSRWQNEFRSVFFFNEHNKDFYARCLLANNERIDDAPKDLKCDIYTHVDNRVDIDYKIDFLDLKDIEDINPKVQDFLRGMMKKTTKK